VCSVHHSYTQMRICTHTLALYTLEYVRTYVGEVCGKRWRETEGEPIARCAARARRLMHILVDTRRTHARQVRADSIIRLAPSAR
jgi:hypothetical protein